MSSVQTPVQTKPSQIATTFKGYAWWQDAVIYQIYPSSYMDSTGDGTGDLRGIISKLPYIKSLGVDAIWISPFFTSPMKDFGYDISDYCDIDPRFGSLDDFKSLLAEAHKLSIKVIIDQVYSHTSDQHAWFLESKQNKTNPKADWYVWADAEADGSPPNNWQSVFGGSAWRWHSARMQYYLHNFLSEQPDLNFHSKEVQSAILDVARFWLDLGVDGFRLDTVNFYFHDVKLRSNPPLGELPVAGNRVNPYHFQEHRYDKTQGENIGFLEDLRTLMDKYDATMAVGEVGEEQLGMEVLAEYTQTKKRLHTCYSFDFLSDVFSPHYMKERVDYLRHLGGLRIGQKNIGQKNIGQKEGEDMTDLSVRSCACWAFSNHDITRSYTRWYEKNLPAGAPSTWNSTFAKFVITLMGTLPGPICLYQGEELGLPEAVLDYEDLKDPYGLYFYPDYVGRDGCRTPMPWNHQAPHAGFSSVEYPNKPWLPIPKEHLPLAVNVQEENPNSPLAFTRAFIAFRTQNLALRIGIAELTVIGDSILKITRSEPSAAPSPQEITGYFNFSGKAIAISAHEELTADGLLGKKTPLFTTHSETPHQLPSSSHKNMSDIPAHSAFLFASA